LMQTVGVVQGLRLGKQASAPEEIINKCLEKDRNVR
jgi:hypothetical protein